MRKARYALDKYSHHLVIGNLLSTRKWEVVFVSAQRGEEWIRVPRPKRVKGVEDGVDDNGKEMVEGDPEVEIESLIIPKVATLHDAHIAAAKG